MYAKGNMKRVIVTGASGFVGTALCSRLCLDGVEVTAAVRDKNAATSCNAGNVTVGEIGPDTRWQEVLAGQDAVVHLAARVHLMEEVADDPLAAYRAVNTEGTLNLARQAVVAGVRRFIYLSSVKVNGEGGARPYTEHDFPEPLGPYAISKYEAEEGLKAISLETGLEVVILRPPLVYGPGVKANFLAMMRWIYKGVPLPLAGVQNARSLVALDNLVDLIATCLNHPAAANQTFLVSDGEDLSTADLLTRMGGALGSPARLFYIPPWLLRLGAKVVNKSSIYTRLCSSLQVDNNKTRQLLGWTPPVSVDEGLRRAAEGFSQ